MTPEALRAKIDAIKTATVPLSISPQDLGEVLEALMETPGESTTSLQEVVEWPTYNDRPAVGEANTIYIDLSDDKMYRWDGTNYVILNDTDSTITIRSLSDLDEQTTVGVYTVLWLQTISGRKSVVPYTLRVEHSVGVVSQYLENKNGYSWRKRQASTGVWYEWQNVIFATTNYVDEIVGDINAVLDLIITGE